MSVDAAKSVAPGASEAKERHGLLPHRAAGKEFTRHVRMAQFAPPVPVPTVMPPPTVLNDGTIRGGTGHVQPITPAKGHAIAEYAWSELPEHLKILSESAEFLQNSISEYLAKNLYGDAGPAPSELTAAGVRLPGYQPEPSPVSSNLITPIPKPHKPDGGFPNGGQLSLPKNTGTRAPERVPPVRLPGFIAPAGNGPIIFPQGSPELKKYKAELREDYRSIVEARDKKWLDTLGEEGQRRVPVIPIDLGDTAYLEGLARDRRAIIMAVDNSGKIRRAETWPPGVGARKLQDTDIGTDIVSNPPGLIQTKLLRSCMVSFTMPQPPVK